MIIRKTIIFALIFSGLCCTAPSLWAQRGGRGGRGGGGGGEEGGGTANPWGGMGGGGMGGGRGGRGGGEAFAPGGEGANPWGGMGGRGGRGGGGEGAGLGGMGGGRGGRGGVEAFAPGGEGANPWGGMGGRGGRGGGEGAVPGANPWGGGGPGGMGGRGMRGGEGATPGANPWGGAGPGGMTGRGGPQEERRGEGRGENNNNQERRDQERRDRGGNGAAAKVEVPNTMGFGVSASANTMGFNGASAASNRYQRPLEDRFDKAVLDRVIEMLKDYDHNKNGFLEYKTDEGKNVTWSFPAAESDRNSDGMLDREELAYRTARILGMREKEAPKAAGTTNNGRGGEAGSEDQKARFRTIAQSMLRQYDENENGKLEREEWARMRNGEMYDVNGDKVVTLEEIIEKSNAFGRDDGGRNGRGGRNGNVAAGGSNPGSMRLLSASERLPRGLPSWFTTKDTNVDGQVSMAEYSASYTDTIVAEFVKYDLNGDGIITPDECLHADGNKSSTASRMDRRGGEREAGAAGGRGFGGPGGGGFGGPPAEIEGAGAFSEDDNL